MSQVSAPRLNEVPEPYVSITAAAKRCQTKWERIHRMIDSKLITAHTIDGWPHPVIHGDDIATITELIRSRRRRKASKAKRLGADLITLADAADRLGVSDADLYSTAKRCGDGTHGILRVSVAVDFIGGWVKVTRQFVVHGIQKKRPQLGTKDKA